MTREKASEVLLSHLRHCAMLMPTEWIDKYGSGELMEAFELALEALREPWISVEDRMPEPMKDVLAFYPKNNKIDIDLCLRSSGFVFEDCFGPVTHWMPLPEPPEGGAEG